MGNTILLLAVKAESEELTKMLIDAGADLHQRYRFSAMVSLSEEAEQLIIIRRAKEAKEYDHKYTVLMVADCKNFNNPKSKLATLIREAAYKRYKIEMTLLKQHNAATTIAAATHSRLGCESPMILLPQFLIKDIIELSSPKGNWMKEEKISDLREEKIEQRYKEFQKKGDKPFRSRLIEELMLKIPSKTQSPLVM